MMRGVMRGFVVAARPLYLPGGLLLYAIGVALGRGPRDGAAIAAGAVVVTVVHVLTHFVNDAADVVTDDRTASPTVFNGGSRAIQRGLVTPRELHLAAAALAALVLLLAAMEAAHGLPRLAALHLAILVLGYAYSGAPFAFGRRGLGEVVTALVMGVLVPVAGAEAAGGATAQTLALTLPLFAETAFARLSTAYPDLAVDRATAKWTLPAWLGERRASLAFGAVALAIAAAGLAVAPALPAPGWQRACALAVASAAALVAWLVGSGRAARRPILVPLVGLGVYGASLVVVLAVCLAR